MPRTNGLARAAVRFKPAAFMGTFVALFMAAMVVTACGVLLETGLRASVPPTRYASAPVVAAADQRAHFITGTGEERTDNGAPVPDRARLDHALVARAAAVDGARAAVPDVTYPVRAGGHTLTAHGWGATAFTGEQPSKGRAPGSGEVALTQDTPVRTADGGVPRSGTGSPSPRPTARATSGSPRSSRPPHPPSGSTTGRPSGSPATPAGSTPSQSCRRTGSPRPS